MKSLRCSRRVYSLIKDIMCADRKGLLSSHSVGVQEKRRFQRPLRPSQTVLPCAAHPCLGLSVVFGTGSSTRERASETPHGSEENKQRGALLGARRRADLALSLTEKEGSGFWALTGSSIVVSGAFSTRWYQKKRKSGLERGPAEGACARGVHLRVL